MAATENSENCEKLSELFDRIWSSYEELENSSEPANSDGIQNLIETAVEQSERAVHMVNDLSLFATNEQIDEVATKEIRYLMLPALLGYFLNKNTKLDRFDAIQKSQVYFIDFVRLCKLYGLTERTLPKPYSLSDDTKTVQSAPPSSHKHSAADDLKQQAVRRQQKVDQFKQHRQLDKTLTELHQYAKQEHADEELVRKYYLTLVSKWLLDSFENLDLIDAELPMLEHMLRLKDKTSEELEKKVLPPEKPKQPLRPFIITKNEVQKTVFGLGYPSIPTVTVDEFYKQRVEEGVFPSSDHSHANVSSTSGEHKEEEARQTETEAEEKENKVEADDEETLRRARMWDDWKDDHRRGWGNTQNKG